MAKIAVRVTDSIESIARDFGVTKEELLKSNNMKMSDVKVGMKIVVEEKLPVKYSVRPFDTVTKIAKEFDVSEEKLREFNGIKEVFLGEIIYIPSE